MMNFGFSQYGYEPFGGLSFIFMLLWMALLIAGIVALLKWAVTQDGRGGKTRTPFDILKERYARGEIDKAEFEEKKRDLL